MLDQLRADHGTELRIDSGKHLRELLHLRHREPACDEGVGHLEPDIARTDDQCAFRGFLLDRLHHLEGVAHRVEKVHAVGGAKRIRAGESGNRRPNRYGTSADDELVVGEGLIPPIGTGHDELLVSDIDSPRDGLETEPHPRRLKVRDGAMGEVVPVGDLP